MTEENKNIPVDQEPNGEEDRSSRLEQPQPPQQPPQSVQPPSQPPASMPEEEFEDDMGDRLERLGGEPAPVITPEEFARLQKAGQVHIDARGRVRTASRSGPNAGVSLRKRRAWYGA